MAVKLQRSPRIILFLPYLAAGADLYSRVWGLPWEGSLVEAIPCAHHQALTRRRHLAQGARSQSSLFHSVLALVPCLAPYQIPRRCYLQAQQVLLPGEHWVSIRKVSGKIARGAYTGRDALCCPPFGYAGVHQATGLRVIGTIQRLKHCRWADPSLSGLIRRQCLPSLSTKTVRTGTVEFHQTDMV